MKNHFTYLTVVAITLLFCSCKNNVIPFKKKDVRSAQKLIGLDFQKKEIKTVYQYLANNNSGYDSLRAVDIGNEVFPALLFDPLPRSFVMPKPTPIFEWTVAQNVSLPDDLNELAFYSIRQLAALIKNKKITSLQLTKMYLARLKKYDPELECVISLTEDLALKQAMHADKEIAAGHYRGLLHGIPYGVKDLIAVEGYKTTWGAAPYKNQTINYTATVIKKLEDAGAVLVAKLTSGALARGDVWFGGKTKNPWDTQQGASGSSAGSASATAAGLVAFSLGTETWGSIVSPSSRCGLTGLRPTYGRVSRYGVMSLSWSMDKLGTICRSAEDAAIVFAVINGADEKDPTLIDAPFNIDPTKNILDLKVAYLASVFEKDTSTAAPNRNAALEKLKAMGIKMDRVVLPKTLSSNAYDVILRAEAGAFFDELVRSGAVDNMKEQTQRSRANSLRQARFIPAVEYIQANRHRRVLIENMNRLMQQYDVIVAPTFGGGQTLMTNLTGHPALALPVGLDKDGHPTSITLIGNLFDEGSILELGIAFQNATKFDEMHPPKYEGK